MAGMIPVMVIWGTHDPLARNPASVHFWGMMSLATIIGGFVAYPINKWLVSKGLKHGMMTIRKEKHEHMHEDKHEHGHEHHAEPTVSQQEVYKALMISLIGLAVGIVVGIIGAYI